MFVGQGLTIKETMETTMETEVETEVETQKESFHASQNDSFPMESLDELSD